MSNSKTYKTFVILLFMKIIKYFLVLTFPLLCLSACSNNNEENIQFNDYSLYEPNMIVAEVNDYVRFIDIDPKFREYNELNNETYLYGEYVICFDENDIHHELNSRNSNNYYIIDGDNYLSPLDLKVGDKLFFKYTKKLVTSTTSATPTQSTLSNNSSTTNGITHTINDANASSYTTYPIYLFGTELYLCK